MTSEEKLIIRMNKMLGEYTGTLMGVMAWNIPDELKLKLENKIKELEKIKI